MGSGNSLEQLIGTLRERSTTSWEPTITSSRIRSVSWGHDEERKQGVIADIREHETPSPAELKNRNAKWIGNYFMHLARAMYGGTIQLGQAANASNVFFPDLIAPKRKLVVEVKGNNHNYETLLKRRQIDLYTIAQLENPCAAHIYTIFRHGWQERLSTWDGTQSALYNTFTKLPLYAVELPLPLIVALRENLPERLTRTATHAYPENGPRENAYETATFLSLKRSFFPAFARGEHSELRGLTGLLAKDETLADRFTFDYGTVPDVKLNNRKVPSFPLVRVQDKNPEASHIYLQQVAEQFPQYAQREYKKAIEQGQEELLPF